jgi:hypothetical protein
MDGMKNKYGYIFSLGSGAFVMVLKEATKAKYILTGLATKHAIWLKRILQHFGEKTRSWD